MNKLRVGIIGTGMAFERLHYPAYQKLADRYEIVALCDRDPQHVQQWGQRLNLPRENLFTDFQQMLARNDLNLDVIDIMVPIEQNFTVAEAAAKGFSGQRKGIICEKPLAPTLRQAKAARDLANQYNVPVMIAENYRYNEETNVIRDLVRNKQVGDVFYFIQNRVVDFPQDMYQNKFPAKEWRQHPDFHGGAIMDYAIHDIAALRHIFGPVDRLQAFGRPQTRDFSPFSVVNVNLLFKGGLTGQFSFFCAGKEMQRPLIGLRIFGTNGMIYLEEQNCGVINVAFNDGGQRQIPYQPEMGYYNELLNFYNALTGREPISVTPEMEYGDLKTIEDILKSVREEKIVSVDEVLTYRPAYQTTPQEHRPYSQ